MSLFIGFVPTPPEHVDAFLELARITAVDVVYDLGCGDGRLLFAALERGAAKAVGIELDSDQLRTARETTAKKGVESRVTFLQIDVMDTDLTSASVVLCYLTPAASTALKTKLESELRPGARVIMEVFPVPGWQPDRVLRSGCREFYLYVMPPRNVD